MPKFSTPFTKIRKGWEFDLIFRTGIRVNGELVRLLYIRDENDPDIKFGCAVGKRLGKAHLRNRGKRILRHAFQELSRTKKLMPGLKIILSLKDKGLDVKTQDILRELEILFRRKKLISM